MYSSRSRNGTPSPPKTAISSKAPASAKLIQTKVESHNSVIIWEIKGITNVKEKKLWNVPDATFTVGYQQWKLHLHLSSNTNVLYLKPELVDNPNRNQVSYILRPAVLNAQNFVIHSPQFGPDHALNYETEGQKTEAWELLRFNDGIIDLFNNYIFNDTLRLMIDMTVFISETLAT